MYPIRIHDKDTYYKLHFHTGIAGGEIEQLSSLLRRNTTSLDTRKSSVDGRKAPITGTLTLSRPSSFCRNLVEVTIP